MKLWRFFTFLFPPPACGVRAPPLLLATDSPAAQGAVGVLQPSLNAATILPAKSPSATRIWAKTRQLQKPLSKTRFCFTGSGRGRRGMSIPLRGAARGAGKKAGQRSKGGSPPQAGGPCLPLQSTHIPCQLQKHAGCSACVKRHPSRPLPPTPHLFHLPNVYAAAVASLK